MSDSESEMMEETYGPVAWGETLWGIVQEWVSGNGYNINQSMLAVQHRNPGAFGRGNINVLKEGAILRMPSPDDVGRLTSTEATLEVMRQDDEYRTYTGAVVQDYVVPDAIEVDSSPEDISPEDVSQEDVAETTVDTPLVEVEEDESTEAAGTATVAQDTQEEQAQETAVQGLQKEPVQEEPVQEEPVQETTVQVLQEESTVPDTREKPAGPSPEPEAIAKESESIDPGQVESRPEQPPVAVKPGLPLSTSPHDVKDPWYVNGLLWVAGISILLIISLMWGFRRAGKIQVEPGVAETPQETVLPEVGVAEDKLPTGVGPEAGPVPLEGFESGDEKQELAGDDLEVKVELARAYLSMGDKEAAKYLLDEVLSAGVKGQGNLKAEARKILKELG